MNSDVGVRVHDHEQKTGSRKSIVIITGIAKTGLPKVIHRPCLLFNYS